MKQELTLKFEARMAQTRSGNLAEKSGILELLAMETALLEAGADPAIVQEVKESVEHMLIRNGKTELAYKAFHEKVDRLLIKSGVILPRTGT